MSRIALLTIILIGLITNESFALTADDIRVLKISGQDQRAVVNIDGKMKVIKTGDVLQAGDKTVSNPELRVSEIASGRVVVEEKTGKETETAIIRLEDGKQRVERIKKTPGHLGDVVACVAMHLFCVGSLQFGD